MNNKEIERIIAKQLSGEATSQENQFLRQWLNSNPQNKDEFSKIALSYQLSNGKTLESGKSAVFSKIKSRIETEEKMLAQSQQKTIHLHPKHWLSIAATILVLVSSGIWFFFSQKSSPINGQETSSVVTKSNPPGQKSKVFLPDGSIVWLNSESTISYQPEFSDSCRHIYLEGEAFFEVQRSPDRPFVVFSGSVSTTALGTAFNINAFDQSNITVSLTHGKINVEAGNGTGERKAMIIDAGEGIVYDTSNELIINKISIDPKKVMMWRNGLLYLENASLKETIELLERWYGVKIELQNQPVKTWNANGLFDNEYLDNVLQSLSFSQGFDYRIKGKKVFVSFKK